MATIGWLFDLYPLNDRVVLWFITPEGKRLRLVDEFPYVVYLAARPERLRQLARAAAGRRDAARRFKAVGRDLWSGREIQALGLEVRSYADLPRLRAWLGTLPDDVAVYNADLDLAAYYCYVRGCHPCAWYEVDADRGRLLGLAPLEDRFAPEFSLPPLAVLELGLTRDPLIPLGRGNSLALGWEGRTYELEAPDAPALLAELAGWLKRTDPDLALSDWGDEEIIPPLWHWSRQYRIPLPLDRESGVRREFRAARSYFSYGRIVYQGSAAPFYGRWHVDRRNSFFYREAGLMGLAQIARLGQMPLQSAARASPGTLITSMQLARAVADGIFIPWRKGEPERFKSALELLTIDKGGLTFMPPPGLHFDVAEVDFASMYPTIMTIHNISPETVHCACCKEGEEVKGYLTENRKPKTENCIAAPEAGYRLCRRREGIVPRTLRPILALREELKARAKAAAGKAAAHYKARQNALKWMLVTCFGYLGYKNARFGRIEAHEAVTAYGRDKLLTAKEICEAAGYEVLHGLTDCLWIKGAALDDAALAALCRDISQATGVKLALEGVYRWICFAASKQNPERPVATRYFGVFTDGQMKVRGLMCRRRDTPPVVRRAQKALLACMAKAGTPAALAALQPELAEIAEGFRRLLREGGVTARDLVITRVLSQKVEDFKVDTPTALAARQLQRAGIHLHPGEKVRYVHREPRRGPKELRVQAAPFLEYLEDYDAAHYLDLLERAVKEVMPFSVFSFRFSAKDFQNINKLYI
jgi:DNA polymerase-2